VTSWARVMPHNRFRGAVGAMAKAVRELAVILDGVDFFFFKQETAYEIGLGIPAEPLFRSRMVLAAEGRKANDSHADCYQYFCVPEYGTANGRLHFHAVHFMRTLPTGSVDPNFGRRVRNRRQLNSLQNTWPYGYS